MGVYYFFRNITQDKSNEKEIPGYDLKWIAKFNYIDEAEMLKIFKAVVSINGWAETDKILASPDYHDHPSFTYQNGQVDVVVSEEDEENWPEEDDCDY